MTDTLSEVLRAVRLKGAVFFAIDASAPWVAETPQAGTIAPYIMPGVEHVIEYHVGADRTEIICGFLGCDARPFNPLLSTLPRVLHMHGTGESDGVLRRLVDLAVVESTAPRAGSDCVLSRLSELLFVEAVRRYVAALPPENVGWFAGLRDESIGRALGKLHQRPAHPWSLEELAKEVGMSRSMLAERFAHFVGVPPIQYLAQWRIQLAASLLRTSKSSLAKIAERVGYGSEAALSRAFKRWVGIAPAPYRRGEVAPLVRPD